MHADLDIKFEEVAHHAIEEASDIECSLCEFQEGLAVMLEAIRIRIQEVKDEINCQ